MTFLQLLSFALVQFVLFNFLPFLYQSALGLGDAFATHLITFCVPSFIVVSPLKESIVGGVIAIKKEGLCLKHHSVIITFKTIAFFRYVKKTALRKYMHCTCMRADWLKIVFL